MKEGDLIQRTSQSFLNAVQGKTYFVHSVSGRDLVISTLDGEILNGFYMTEGFRVVEENLEVSTDNYAAAFNMWMDEYVNAPQSFEDSYTTALNHVSEKLLGEEPSYGAVAAEQFKEYLNRVSQLESK
jgi:hypothetical protein